LGKKFFPTGFLEKSSWAGKTPFLETKQTLLAKTINIKAYEHQHYTREDGTE